MSLHRLAYYSRNRLVDLALAQAAITDILAVSRRNNARDGVTGALMFNAGCFGQVLEGEPARLEHTFERIQQDERHGDVSLLAFTPITARAFENWSMGYVGASARAGAQFDMIAGESGFDPSRMDGERLFQTLRTLALEEEADAAA